MSHSPAKSRPPQTKAGPPPAAPASPERTLARAGGVACLLVGAGLVFWTVLRAVSDNPPATVLSIALFLAGTLDVILGAGLLRSSRTAWAFALALNLVMGVVGLFALPAIARSSAGLAAGGAVVAVVAGVVAVLITAKSEF
jgi:hypothetical protein